MSDSMEKYFLSPGVQFNEATPDDFKVNCAHKIREPCCGSLHVNRKVNRPIYEYSCMAQRLSGQTSIFWQYGVSFILTESFWGIQRQRNSTN